METGRYMKRILEASLSLAEINKERLGFSIASLMLQSSHRSYKFKLLLDSAHERSTTSKFYNSKVHNPSAYIRLWSSLLLLTDSDISST